MEVFRNRAMDDMATVRVPGRAPVSFRPECFIQTLRRLWPDVHVLRPVYDIPNTDIEVKTAIFFFDMAEDQSLASFVPSERTAQVRLDVLYLAHYFDFRELVAALERPLTDDLAGGDGARFSSDDASATVSERITAALRFSEVMSSVVRYFPSLQSDSTRTAAEAWDGIQATARDFPQSAWENVGRFINARCEKLSSAATTTDSVRRACTECKVAITKALDDGGEDLSSVIWTQAQKLLSAFSSDSP
jgi:hypothetical protein